MDPFTEKLLERTRARRENLQRKLAERPNAANRQMVKRPREPLTESNNTITDSNVDKVPDSTPPTLSKRPVEVQPPASLPPSEAPAGRRGRLANLAATIGSWEDDLSHAHIPKGNPGSGSVPRPAVRVAAAAAGSKQTAALSSSATADTSQSPVKSSQMILSSPQKAEISASKTAIQTVQSPLKNPKQEAALPPSPHMATSSEATSAPKRLLQISVSKRCIYIQTGVKSFLERFGERCQQHKEQGAPPRAPTPARSAPSTASVTPNTKLVQERLRAAQAAHTATAELTQRQKMERESELAQIRSRFQKGKTVWEHKDKRADETHTDNKVGFRYTQYTRPLLVPNCPNLSSFTTGFHLFCELFISIKCLMFHLTVCPGIALTPPVSTSSPMRGVSQPGEKPSKEKEMNVDHSINSAVINELFDGVLEQSEDQEDEEEDALNISSMSLLTPLAETVAAVVKSPDRRLVVRMMLQLSDATKSSCSPGKFQRTTVARSDSSDEDHRLPYSIDAYRSIRVKEPERPAVKQVIVRREDVSKRVEEPRAASLFSMKQRMKMLTSEVNLQQTVIHQASQALNCCTDEEHGKGSQVEAEAERLLLLATEKREALKAELDCLKGEPAGQKKTCHPEPAAISASKGSIILQELRLPLKADFVCSTANKPDSTKHSFFIMIRAGAENMVATPLASTHRGLSGDTLTFPTKFTLSDVSSDFKIDLEVYCLVCVILLLVKLPYSILVPNGLAMVSFRYKNVSSAVPFLCPLEGHIHLQLQCEVGCSTVEERGFLTMFEDVSGFGAWHRRWCVLSGYCISYWTYPDDEKRKNPIGRINLANCTSEKVEPANREFCARPNTFELITVRPQREDDKETLVSQCMDTMCVTKNWLSADTKDERNLWMKKLNQILEDLRMGQPAACYKPSGAP
uniref:Anillin n=1 Tax=Poecilia latipinna TaxID=48699 RepID=A0A3B3ULI4_9TELE